MMSYPTIEGSQAANLSEMPYPGDLCCTFYEERDYGGSSATDCMVEGETEHEYQPGDFGDKISSFECGKNVRFEFHNHNSPSTGYEIVSGAGHIRGSRLENYMEDRVTAVIMRPYDQFTQASVTVWGWLNCEDIGAELRGPSEIGDTVTYTTDEAWQHGMKKKEMESF